MYTDLQSTYDPFYYYQIILLPTLTVITVSILLIIQGHVVTTFWSYLASLCVVELIVYHVSV